MGLLFMIIGSITATCLTYTDCTDHKHDMFVNNMSNILYITQSLLASRFELHTKLTPKDISIKLYYADIYNQNMFIE